MENLWKTRGISTPQFVALAIADCKIWNPTVPEGKRKGDLASFSERRFQMS